MFKGEQAQTRFTPRIAMTKSKIAFQAKLHTFVHIVMLALFIIFGVKVTQSVIEYMEGKVARSTKDMFEQYVKFPTISICIGIDDSEEVIGFEDLGTRPVNATLKEFQFARHMKNGYVLQPDPSYSERPIQYFFPIQIRYPNENKRKFRAHSKKTF